MLSFEVPCCLLLSFLGYALATVPAFPSVRTISSQPATGASVVSFTSRAKSLDSPYLSSINSSVFEWWWFDAVSQDAEESVTVIFFTTTAQAFPLLGGISSVVSVAISGRLSNGTIFSANLPASQAVITSGHALGDGIAATFDGTGTSFASSPDANDYIVAIDAMAEAGVRGSIRLNGVAPPHYPCSSNLSAGQDVHVFPHLGWSNAIPAADACVTLSVTGTPLQFESSGGYHDHNWGDIPFPEVLQFWYWGHARAGPYTVVWFSGADPSGTTHQNAYVAENGQILISSCDGGFVRVTATGDGVVYPPQPGDPDPEELKIEFKLPKSTLVLGVTPKTKVAYFPGAYSRWTGDVKASMANGPVFNGISLFEQFTF